MSKESMECIASKALPVSPVSTAASDEDQIIFVEFESGDQRNPQNYPLLIKWAITLAACYFSGLAGAIASSFSISVPSMRNDLHCTDMEAALGLGLYAMGFAITPLVTSSFSEEVGRRPVYIVSAITFTLNQAMIALAPNMKVVLAGRALSGVFGSMATLTGGSIADIWKPEDRSIPMTLFALSSLFSLGLGSVIGGVIQSSHLLGWRWVQWMNVIFSGIFVIFVLLMSETRSSIILIRMAQAQRKLTGINVYRARAEIDKESLWSLIKVSTTRPFYFLLTEPIVQCFSVWCGFVWGVVYCLLEAVSPIFQSVYGFDIQQTGYVYVTLSIGGLVGFFANLYQDRLYKKYVSRKKQEARLYLACVAAVCLPISMFIVAWTATPKIHWVVPMIGLTVFSSGVLIIFQVAFLYLADCYNTYASSAQAGQSLSRNLLATVFPLFTKRMFDTLSYTWALTLFGAVALVMAPTPFVLYYYGSKIRARSFASRQILAASETETEMKTWSGTCSDA